MPQPSTFASAPFDATQWEEIEPRLQHLLDHPPTSRATLEQWLVDRSELEAACSEAAATLYINMTCDTDNPAARDAYLHYVEHIAPRIKPIGFELDKLQASLCERFSLTTDRYLILHRDTNSAVTLYRDENVPLQTELDKLSQQYQQVTGAMTVQFDGQEKTLPQMGVYQEATDRTIRERAYRTVTARRLQDVDTIHTIFDDMIRLRDQVARNADCADYVEYAFKSRLRFDYTPRHCFDFHEACEKRIVPLVRALDAKRRDQLGVDALRPWDLSVDPKGRAPLTPFKGGADLVARTQRVFDQLDPQLAAMFRDLGDGASAHGARDGSSLDLDSRKGKAPGGYQYMRDLIRKPFIFMNAAGMHHDIETMVHEAGHAFHSVLCNDEPLLHYRHAPIEFCEVASMSMELLTMPHWDAFYPDPSDLARARRKQLEGSIALLPWIATIDAFQHWLYSNPKHTRDQRRDAWRDLVARFGNAVSWEGLEPFRDVFWQRQGHLFSVPFYYIEYGIARLGSLQLWLRSLEESPAAALNAYKRAMTLGGSRPLPELFAAAGLRFDFGLDTVSRLVDCVERELEKLPE